VQHWQAWGSGGGETSLVVSAIDDPKPPLSREAFLRVLGVSSEAGGEEICVSRCESVSHRPLCILASSRPRVRRSKASSLSVEIRITMMPQLRRYIPD
jgi:hypothetical protein